jgi:hypothetical protein
MTRRVSIKASPVEQAQPEEPPAGTPSAADGEPAVVAEDQTAAAADPEEAEEDVRSGAPAPVAEEKEPATVAEPEPDAEMDILAFAIDEAPGVPVPASSMDSLTLPERSRHDADVRRERRRRSAVSLPALVSPVDIPEDAEGRVDFAVTRGGADHDEPAAGESAAAAKSDDRVRRLLTLGSGWVAVAVVAAGLVVVFVVLSLLYR